jgi:diguanylate cyclase (GGDEF)-like protein/PAS domain S-box-containing protein
MEGTDAWLHFIDVRAEHGVHLAVLIPHDTAEAAGAGPGRNSSAAPDSSRVVADHSHSGWMRKDERAVILEADSEVCALLGYSSVELEGLRTLELIHPDDRDLGLTSWIDMLSHPGKSRRVRLRHRRADGSYLWCEVVNRNALADPHSRHVLSQLTDVNAEVIAQVELAAQQQTLRTLAETLTVGIALVDASGRVAYANAAMLALTGSPTGDHVSDLLHSLHPADLRHGQDAYRRAVSTGAPVRVTVRVSPPGCVEPLLVRLDISPTGDGGAVACAADVTEETRLHEQLERQATCDALTGCWNRTAVLSMLEAAVSPPRADRGRRHGDHRVALDSGVAVLYIDLDGFKAVNDERGHAAGDVILVRAADRLRAALRDTDDIGRLGGDEFLLVCPNVADRDGARALAEHVRTALAGDDPIPVSVGVAWTGVPVSADALVASADLDMYAEKVVRRAAAALAASTPF